MDGLSVFGALAFVAVVLYVVQQAPHASCVFCRGPIFPNREHRCPLCVLCFVADPRDDDFRGGVRIRVHVEPARNVLGAGGLGAACALLEATPAAAAGVAAAAVALVGEPVAAATNDALALLRRLLMRSTEAVAALCEVVEIPRTALVSFQPLLTPLVLQARAIAAGVLRIEETEDEGPIKPGHENCPTCGTGTYRRQMVLNVASRQARRLRPNLLTVPSAKGRKQGRCGICFEDFERSGEPIAMIHDHGHGHFYHSACINMWFDQCERNPGRLLRYTCPLCGLEE